jgi:hypothetical protein
MEIVQNRYGHDRVIEKISHNKLRVMGESLFSRNSKNDEGEHIMFDFEGGPCLNVGGIIKYLKTEWVIKNIQPEETSQENLVSVVLQVELK